MTMTRSASGLMAFCFVMAVSVPAAAQDWMPKGYSHVPRAGHVITSDVPASYESRRPGSFTYSPLARSHQVRPPAASPPLMQQAAVRYEHQPQRFRPQPRYQPAPAMPPVTAAPQMPVEEEIVAPVTEAAEPESSEDTAVWEFSGGMTLTTDYVFRGYSQTDENPAVQGYITLAHEIGLSATVWASNVDFDDGDQAHSEFDGIVAYDFDIGPGTASLGGAYYYYPGADSDLNYDYGEGFLTYTHGFFADALSLAWSAYYSPEFFGQSGSATYLALAPSFALPFLGDSTLDVTGSGGYQWIEENDTAAIPDYWNWSAGVSHTWDDKITLGVKYHDTDVDRVDCSDLCVGRAVLTLDYSL